MGFASLKYSMNQHRSTASKSCIAQACLTQYAASDAVLDKAAKGHQSLARSPFLTCPEQMQCHGDGHAQHANHCVAHHIKPMSSAVSSESGSFPGNKKSVHLFSQGKKPDPFALAYDGVVSRRSHKSSVPLLLVGIFGFYLVWHGASLRPTEIRPWSVAGCARGGR